MEAPPAVSEEDKRMAQRCLECPLCNYARRKQKGLVFRLVQYLEKKRCPYGMAYTRVYKREPHEPLLKPEPSAPSPDSLPQ